MAVDAARYYDQYWAERDGRRTEARSRERARAAVELFRGEGVASGRLLDAGCGPGYSLDEFRAAGFDAIGVDASASAVESARARGHDARTVDLEAGSSLAAAGLAAPFAGIAALEVLEHLVDPLRVLTTLAPLLAPAGRLVVSLPNEVALPARLRVLAGRLPFGGHDDPHIRHFDRRSARRLIAASGLRLLGQRSVNVLPPRWGALRAATLPLVNLWPGAFAIATLYLLAPATAGGPFGD